jgi:hypothetical protein
MSDLHGREARRAMISEAHTGPLDAEATADLELMTDLLSDPSTWAEPPADLEDRVVDAVATATPAPEASRSRSHRVPKILGVAAAAIAVVVTLTLVTTSRSAPPQYAASLRATALAPGARASARIMPNGAGFHVTLDAHGLAPLPAGGYYQAWLTNAAGIGVPIGTFSSSDGRVTLWSGVSPASFPKLTVTIEAPDGNQASSGRVVLIGFAVRHGSHR